MHLDLPGLYSTSMVRFTRLILVIALIATARNAGAQVFGTVRVVVRDPQSLAARLSQPVPSARAWRPDVPAELDAVVGRMMAIQKCARGQKK